MCIIIIQPEGYVFEDDRIVDFYDRNAQGFGFMWMDGKRGLQGVRTVPKDEHAAIALYHKYAAGKQGVIHYRFATSGPVTTEMAHPFAVSKDLLVMHNGVLPGGSKTESDTFQFVRDTLKPLLGKDYRVLYEPDVKVYLEGLVQGSAVVFLDKEGVITKLGRRGVEYDGCWYSNTYAWTLPPELGGFVAGEGEDADVFECLCTVPYPQQDTDTDTDTDYCLVCGGSILDDSDPFESEKERAFSRWTTRR